ncbi:MAG: hypothetical protein IJO77_01385 [Oscillospiraceae bacterium]|nr:hypothetical protein [Oscillospiraceae bacterium]
MLTTEPTLEMINEWKRVYAERRDTLKPNRKSGVEVHEYFCQKYSPLAYDSSEFAEVVAFNAMNEHNAEKLNGRSLQIVTYKVGDVLAGIDLTTGFFHIESEDTDAVEKIHDDLFAFRGLDEMDLKNFFLVAQYIEFTE